MEMPYMHVMCTPCTTGRSCSTLWMLANAFPRLERTKSSYGNRVTTQFTTGFLFRHFFLVFLFFECLFAKLQVVDCFLLLEKFHNSGEWIFNRCSALHSPSLFLLISCRFYFAFVRLMCHIKNLRRFIQTQIYFISARCAFHLWSTKKRIWCFYFVFVAPITMRLRSLSFYSVLNFSRFLFGEFSEFPEFLVIFS